MWNNRFETDTIIKQHNGEYYINVQTDPVDNGPTTNPIPTGIEISFAPYPDARFRSIHNPELYFGDSLVLTRT
jgi:hypothetical protein